MVSLGYRLAVTLSLLCLMLLFNVTSGLALAAVQSQGAQQKPPEQPTPTSALTVESIIQLHKAGIPESVLISKIKQMNKPFDLSTEHLLALNEAKVPAQVVLVMLDPTQDPKPSESKTAPGTVPTGAITERIAPAGDPNDPAAPHDSGIYIIKDSSGKTEMVLLEPAAYTGSKTGGIFGAAMTGGLIKAKQKAIIQGSRASIRVSNPQPVLYFYFEDKSAALGKAGMFGSSPISSPNQFVCIKLEVKKNTRETIVAEVGAFGASSGTDEDKIIQFKSERIRPGVYKVTFPRSLEPGEFALLVGSGVAGAGMAGAAMPLQIFDFAITSGK